MEILQILQLLQIMEILQDPVDPLDPRELPEEPEGLLGSLGMPVRHRGPQRSPGRSGMGHVLGIPSGSMGGGRSSMGGSF
jgi:hypothetical protein